MVGEVEAAGPALPRACGILLHPTSLPGPGGIGDLGPAASRFIDFLAAAGQTYWQMLPLGPTGYGDSPYQTFSAFAGNPFLISQQALVEGGQLPAGEGVPPLPEDHVDYGAVIPAKKALLERAYAWHERRASAAEREEVAAFAAAQRAWLDDFALFMALKEEHGGAPWIAWEPELARREPAALERARRRLGRETRVQAFAQYLFFRQWAALKRHAVARGISIIGDLPIFVAHDSADCWAHPELFALDAAGRPALVAGVPPDYFSATGQLWGNPHYRWEVMAADGYRWWIDRLRATLELVDLVRLDHFRGFAGYWAIPADAPTAETGSWRPGPGAPFFRAVLAALGRLPLIAEDLGVITPDVVALREEFALPGMYILQFAFGGDPGSPDLPHHHRHRAVVYTGTHDNDTTAGWLEHAGERERRYALEYMGEPADPVWGMLRLAYASVAETAIVPLQDALGLGSAARMNTPSTAGGNWQWRLPEGALDARLAARLAHLAELYGRGRP